MGNAHLDHAHGGQDPGIHLLSDADDHGVAVLDAHLSEGIRVQFIHHVGIVRILAQLLHLGFVLIDDDHVLAGLGNGNGQRGAEASEADHAEGFGFLILLHI